MSWVKKDDNLHYEKFQDGTVKCIEDEIPFEVPERWEWCRFSDVISLFSGQDLMPDRYNDKKEGIPYITGASNIENGNVIINRWTTTPTVHATIGDLLLTVKGSGVGKMAFCDIDDVHIARQIMALRGKGDLSRNYLYFVVSAMVKEITAQANGLIPGIRREIVLKTPFPLPPVCEQMHIAEKAMTLFFLINHIENGEVALKNALQEVKARIFDLAICGKLIPQDPDDEPASVLLERIRAEKEELIKQGKIKRDKNESIIYKGDDNSYYEKLLNGTEKCIDSELPFDLPSEWRWERIRNVFIVNPKNHIDDNAEISFVPMALLEDGYSGNYSYKKKRWKECKKGFTHFAKGDICFAKISPCFENRKSTFFKELTGGYGAGTTELYVLRPYTKEILPEYVLMFVKSEYFVNCGRNTFSGVVGQQRIDKKVMLNTFIPIPPVNIQLSIAKIIEQLLEKLTDIESSLS